MTLKNKTVILGVTGSIAAYKAANIASTLAKAGCDVHPILTQNATKIIAPITFSTLTGHKAITETFDPNVNYSVAHVSLAKKADALLIAPATANIIAKLACGLADDMLSTTALACTCPKLIAPAMNTNMYENPVVQQNIQKLKDLGYIIIEPDSGILACKDTGKGKLAPEKTIIDHLLKVIAYEKDLQGKKILISAGPTQESIDPVRFISNHSSGKMGYALAENAMLRGANVTLVSGPVNIDPVPFVKTIPVTSAEDMAQAVLKAAPDQDIIIMAAAVADYTPQTVVDHKIKKKEGDLSLPLTRTRDILSILGEQKKPDQFLCGFSMETENLLENSRQKLIRKKTDMIIANSLKTEGAGFRGDTNVVTLITSDKVTTLPLMPKSEVAESILTQILHQISE